MSVDVGQCASGDSVCSERKKCEGVETRMEVVRGPNGEKDIKCYK